MANHTLGAHMSATNASPDVMTMAHHLACAVQHMARLVEVECVVCTTNRTVADHKLALFCRRWNAWPLRVAVERVPPHDFAIRLTEIADLRKDPPAIIRPSHKYPLVDAFLCLVMREIAKEADPERLAQTLRDLTGSCP